MSDNRLLDALTFWHQVEFFIPFDLRGQVLQANDAEWSVKRVTSTALAAMPGQSSGDLWQVARVPEGKAVRGFELFLGVFDKRVLATVTESMIGAQGLEDSAIEQEERGELEGETCFARIKLSAAGEPLLDQLSVSTVPWALGLVSCGGVEGLTSDAFQASLKRLEEDLQNFQARRHQRNAACERPASVLPLTRTDIESLLTIFHEWAGFAPDESASTQAVIRAVVGKKLVAGTQPAQEGDADELDDDESEAGAPEGVEFEILNSFYVKDIERAIGALRRGEDLGALGAYLAAVPHAQRVDLYSSAGHQRILADLHPHHTPLAHWLDEPGHAMSLMQQFAINNIFSALSDSGIFSVNGPPGTGKTTLLRDLFAENITRRARVLAGLRSARDAFVPGQKAKVTFEGSTTTWSIATLKPELTGFEMLVASSNNAAVNNISEDLPKARSLGAMDWDAPADTAWRTQSGAPRQTYLQSVAIRMAAQTARGAFTPLTPDDTPWGLIACALGKRANRRRFADRFAVPVLSKNHPKDAPRPKGYDPLRHQSFWEWRDAYQGPTFAEAKTAFLALDRAVHERRDELARLTTLLAELADHTEATYTQAHAQRLVGAQAACGHLQARIGHIEQSLSLCQEKLATLREDEKLIRVPSGLTLLLGKIPVTRFWNNPFRAACLAYEEDRDSNRLAQRGCLQEKIALDADKAAVATQAVQARAAVDAAQRDHDQAIQMWRTKDAERHALQQCFSEAAAPATAGELESPHWQKQGVWYDIALNALRSRLFAASLVMHEAWLVEVTAKGAGFSPNLYAMRDLLQGKRLVESEHALALWQSFFMVVPVVSSTFASIASQFRELGAATLGWLFIDEAGQAVPQAAVGALWRAQRAVVVGDPLQIEPVFTVPVKLIEALAKSARLPDDLHVMPHTVSVQNLADAANPCGAWVAGQGDEPDWVGSPLRVHRRCVDPMFRIANAIAYDNKMIFGLKHTAPAADGFALGASAWVHVPGLTRDRHVVPAQIALVTQAVMNLYQSQGALPALYIISPFKRVKQALLESLWNIDAWRAQGIHTLSKSELGKWCQERIGTVHTFQGKEEHMVWMVLGCDSRGEGAVSWAASKPNILNVALTRAKRRFFMIGDVALWGGKRYFQEARLNLEPMSGEAFLGRTQEGRTQE